jgi:cytochrome c oxidase subunit 2
MNPAGVQSALDTALGSSAALIHELGMALYIGVALIFALVMALLIRSVYSDARPVMPRRWIIGGGLAFPFVTLTMLLIYSLRADDGMQAHASAGLRIEVIGKQWWWEVRYHLPGLDRPVTLANELHIPTGQPVTIEVSTTDVIHSFWVPSLAGKMDMIPGRTNRLMLRTDVPGLHRGQCAEYCGAQHALMAFYVIAQPAADYERWLQQQAQPANVPSDPELRRGYDLFFSGGCQACHAVRGTPADSSLGPDLTHVGSRHSLAAGVYDNHMGTLAGWIGGTQDLKPGSLMPTQNIYTGRELRQVSAWLQSLQ